MVDPKSTLAWSRVASPDSGPRCYTILADLWCRLGESYSPELIRAHAVQTSPTNNALWRQHLLLWQNRSINFALKIALGALEARWKRISINQTQKTAKVKQIPRLLPRGPSPGTLVSHGHLWLGPDAVSEGYAMTTAVPLPSTPMMFNFNL